MIPSLGVLIPAKVKRILALTALVLFVAATCLTLGYCEGKKAGEAGMQSALDQANLKATQARSEADRLAADRRLTDTIAVNRQEQELRDAIARTPDSAPDATRIALGCQRLRAAGRDTNAIPACRGLAGGAQARPAG